MMVEIAHPCSGSEHPEQGRAVLVERDVEHRDFIPCYGVDALEQLDIAFDARDERGISGLDETQLLQRAEAVRVAVECIVAGHFNGLETGSSSPRKWGPILTLLTSKWIPACAGMTN